MAPLFANITDVVSWMIVIPVLVFLGYRRFIQSDDRQDRFVLVLKWVASAILVGLIFLINLWHTPIKALFILIPASILGIMWVPTMVSLLSGPMGGLYDGGSSEVDPAPFYSLAEGKRRQGLFGEAIQEIDKQLEKFPDDPPGVLLRATIQAEDMHDLPAAKATVEQFLEQAELTPQSVASCLQALADWQLQFDRDIGAARASLQRIVHLFPDSQAAHAAEQRIARLEGTVATREFREHAKFELPAHDASGTLRLPPHLEVPDADPHALAAEYVKQLELHTNDTATREKLALLYAEKFQRLDLAAAQLEQLISFPNETPKHVAQWLNLLATLQIRHGHDLPAAEKTMRRIIEKFPKSAMANVALARLASLQAELKSGATTVTKALGSYEKDIGLKRSPI